MHEMCEADISLEDCVCFYQGDIVAIENMRLRIVIHRITASMSSIQVGAISEPCEGGRHGGYFEVKYLGNIGIKHKQPLASILYSTAVVRPRWSISPHKRFCNVIGVRTNNQPPPIVKFSPKLERLQTVATVSISLCNSQSHP